MKTLTDRPTAYHAEDHILAFDLITTSSSNAPYGPQAHELDTSLVELVALGGDHFAPSHIGGHRRAWHLFHNELCPVATPIMWDDAAQRSHPPCEVGED